MTSKFLDSTLALAFFSALLFTIGHAYDYAYLGCLHLPFNEFLPPSYLEIARPFDMLFFVRHSNYWHFVVFGSLIAAACVVWALWPRLRHWLAPIGRFLGRIPLVAYVVIGAFAFIALSNWATKFGWTQASNALNIVDSPDWVITLKDGQKMRCRFLTASPERYAVVCRVGADSTVQTIPRDAVSRIDYDPSIN